MDEEFRKRLRGEVVGRPKIEFPKEFIEELKKEARENTELLKSILEKKDARVRLSSAEG